MFAEINSTTKAFYNNLYDHSMKSVALMEDSQKQFAALSFKAASSVEGMNGYVQSMQEAHSQMLDMSYATLRSVSAQVKALTDEVVQNYESSVASVMPKAA